MRLISRTWQKCAKAVLKGSRGESDQYLLEQADTKVQLLGDKGADKCADTGADKGKGKSKGKDGKMARSLQ